MMSMSLMYRQSNIQQKKKKKLTDWRELIPSNGFLQSPWISL